MSGTDLVSRINDLLKLKNIKKADFYTELELPNNATTKWSTGSFPNSVTLYNISQFFGVSMEYLLTGKELEIEQEYLQLVQDFQQLSERDKTIIKEQIKLLKDL